LVDRRVRIEPARSLHRARAFAAPLEGVCDAPAATAPLGPAEVMIAGDLAWVKPGTGDPDLPASVTKLVIDLRGVPEDPALEPALRALLARALETELAAPIKLVRKHNGMTDEVYAELNSSRLEPFDDPPLTASSTPRAIAFVTAPAIAPRAGYLRLRNRAFLVGADIDTRIAESHWIGVGEYGSTRSTGRCGRRRSSIRPTNARVSCKSLRSARNNRSTSGADTRGLR
jgi:hypothetical protein